jgi:hypothetical protein
MRCAICGGETNAVIKNCPLAGGDICMDHCPTCTYFAGRDSWNCTYTWSQGIHRQTRAEAAVDGFRGRMRELNNKIALSEKDKAASE